MKNFAATMYPRLLQSSLPGETRALLVAAALAVALCIYVEVGRAQPVIQVTAPNNALKMAAPTESGGSAQLSLSPSTAISARDAASQRMTEQRSRQAVSPKKIAPETAYIHEQHRKLRPTANDAGTYLATF
jgi:hypothetical protein